MAQNKLEILTEKAAGPYKAMLYDCDGTLADNMHAHKDTYVQVALQQNVTIDPQIIDDFAGLPIPEVVQEINKKYQVNFDPLVFEQLKSELFYNDYIHTTQPISFVVNHLKASAGNYKIGVVSGGSRKMIEKTLEVLGIADFVEVLVCADESERGKPYPDPFLKAAELLGVLPSECLVFEDGEAGTTAATAAGMPWIRIDKI